MRTAKSAKSVVDWRQLPPPDRGLEYESGGYKRVLDEHLSATTSVPASARLGGRTAKSTASGGEMNNGEWVYGD
jgi:hypothetical protein